MFIELDGPASQSRVSVTTTTIQEMKVNASPLDERKVITFQPIGDYLYVYFGDGITTPSVATIQSDGFEYPPGLFSIEAAGNQPVYMLAKNATLDVVFVERA